MRNTEEIERLLLKVKEEEEDLLVLLSKQGHHGHDMEVIQAMKERTEKLMLWIEEYERLMREVKERILRAAEEEVVLYPPTVFGKSHFEKLLEHEDLLLIRGKQVVQQ